MQTWEKISAKLNIHTPIQAYLKVMGPRFLVPQNYNLLFCLYHFQLYRIILYAG